MNGSSYRYLLFDLDGTLVNSVADLTTSLNLLGAERGFARLNPEQVTAMVGDGATWLIKRAFGEDNYQPDMLQRFLEIYADHLYDQTRCYPGIEQLLQRYPADHLAVVTNKPIAATHKLLAGLKLDQYFSVVIGGDSFAEKKPHPLPVEKALEQLKAIPAEAVMIGDHHTDLISGSKAGTATCFCAYGLGHTGGIAPDFSVTQATELLDLFPGL